MDDVFSGGQNISDTINIRDQVIGAMESAGFMLRKWASNSIEVLEGIPIENQIGNPSLSITDNQTIKTFGMYWNVLESKLRSIRIQIKFRH